MHTVKVLPKGQITIPKDVRKHMGIKEGDTLVIEKDFRRIENLEVQKP